MTVRATQFFKENLKKKKSAKDDLYPPAAAFFTGSKYGCAMAS
jgi:hypothetical protein